MAHGMTVRLGLGDIARLTLARQHLIHRAGREEMVRVVRDLAGLHATAPTTPYLSLFARLEAFSKDRLAEALYRDHSLVRVRCVRQTIYVLAREDLPVMHAATAPKAIAASRRFAEGRGVTEARYQALANQIVQLLTGREMTAADIKRALSTDLDVSAALYLMCDEGRLVRGRPAKGWRDRAYAYARFADWLPDVDLHAVPEPQAVARLVRSYLAAYGPASEEDIAWWTGLARAKVRRALADLAGEVAGVCVSGVADDLLMLRRHLEGIGAMKSLPDPAVRLLPVLDPLLMGHRDRARFLDEAFHGWVFDRSGNATSVILIRGRVAGVWDFEPAGGPQQPIFKLFFFADPGEDLRGQVHDEALAVGRFIADADVGILECAGMTPLPQRTAGGMMSPLKGS